MITDNQGDKKSKPRYGKNKERVKKERKKERENERKKERKRERMKERDTYDNRESKRQEEQVGVWKKKEIKRYL
jgi:hypothetical protein